MENKKLTTAAKNLDCFAKVGEKLFLPCAILLGAFAIILLILGEKFFDTADFSLTLDYVEVSYAQAAQMPELSLKIHFIVGCICAALLLFAGWYALKILRKVLVPMKLGRPFDESVPKDLRKLGWVMLICGSISSVVKLVAISSTNRIFPVEQLFDKTKVAQVELMYAPDLNFLWAVSLCFFLSLIFQYGQQLQQESDETL